MQLKRWIAASAATVLVATGLVGTTAPVSAASIRPTPTPTAVAGIPAPPKVGTPGKAATTPARWKATNLHKVPDSSAPASFTACASPCYYYAGGKQTGMTATGASTNVSIKKPWKSPSDYHTLGESAVIRGSGATRQIVEIGYTVDPVVNGGSSDPYLFVGAWKNNTFLGYNAAGGFVDEPGCATNAGTSLAAAVGSTTKRFVTFYDSTTPVGGGWWIWYGEANPTTTGCYVGYYPISVWSGVTPAFTGIDQVQLFGETVTARTEPCSDMGSGDFAAGGVGTSAHFASHSLIGGSVAAALTYFTVPGGVGYDVAAVSGSARTFTFGGPGWNSAGTATGTKGSC